MNATQYRKAIESLGLNQSEAAEFLDVTWRTSANYASKGAPDVVAKLLFVMIERGISVEDVNKLTKRKMRTT